MTNYSVVSSFHCAVSKLPESFLSVVKLTGGVCGRERGRLLGAALRTRAGFIGAIVSVRVTVRLNGR